MATINHPHGTTLTALKGLAITTSLLTAGQLGTITLTLPSLYPAAQTSHRLAAQQFAHIQKTTGPTTGILTALICGGLAYVGWRDSSGKAGTWNLWAAAGVCMASTIPWTSFFMSKLSRKLLWVSEVADSATTPLGPPASSIGIRVTEASPRSGSALGIPTNNAARAGTITPMEEFEPFEDALMADEYEQLKVIMLLRRWNWYNGVRALLPLVSGGLGLWAALTE